MLRGLRPWHIRLLIDDPWNGGCGHSLKEVAEWTLDQVIMALVDRRKMMGGTRTVDAREAAAMADPDGTTKGRAGDGTPIRARIGGRSVARRLMDRAEERRSGKRGPKRRGRKGR